MHRVEAADVLVENTQIERAQLGAGEADGGEVDAEGGIDVRDVVKWGFAAVADGNGPVDVVKTEMVDEGEMKRENGTW